MAETVLAIRSSISNTVQYVKIDDLNVTVDAAINAAIKNLNDSGKRVEGASLNNMYQSHMLFNNAAAVSKGDLLSSLKATPTKVNDREVNVIPLELTSAHSGGRN